MNMQSRQHTQHWDDPDNQGTSMSYDDAPMPAETKVVAVKEEEYYEEEESRELTHDEIWDDSALIDAWNSAAAEYEVCPVRSKAGATRDQLHHTTFRRSMVRARSGSKNRPKSLLCTFALCSFTLLGYLLFVSSWYNIPPEKTKTSKGGSKASFSKPNGTQVEEVTPETGLADSVPINFDTFVPMHDPSLAAVAATGADTGAMMDGVLGSGAEAAMVSQDEAFSRAMTAMYWSGYWTAVHHVRVGSLHLANQLVN